MVDYEYKVIYKPTGGMTLMPWAPQKMKDEMGHGCLERKINEYAREGYEVDKVTTSTKGFLFMYDRTLVVMRRAIRKPR